MGKIIIRCWRDYPINACSLQHVSLQTTERYFSFLPDSKEETKHLHDGLNIPAKYSTLTNDMSIAVPDNKVVIDLNSAAINQAIDLLQSMNLQWQFWGKEFKNGFNSATTVLHLLKIGGLAAQLNNTDYMYSNNEYADESLRELFSNNPLKNEKDFILFSKNANESLSPEDVYTLAQSVEIRQKKHLNHRNKYLLGASAIGGAALGGLLAGPVGSLLGASIFSGVTKYSQLESPEKDDKEILNEPRQCVIP